MAKPIFIICSKSGSIDSKTHQTSIYHIVEKVIFAHTGEHLGSNTEIGLPVLLIRTTAVWAREPGDEGRDFVYQFAIDKPGADEAILQEGSFTFKGSRHRFLMDCALSNIAVVGQVKLIIRIKPAGSDEWIQQEYPIDFELANQSPETSEHVDQSSVND